ncbi:nuclear transport factor 2 family protein [Roseateles flavus]|uniref:Nuclear transport factor 2 family protein n=1 Tax=Roseateles flavus TaxID=3149041 RepID=A0ABV0GE60_9BURK
MPHDLTTLQTLQALEIRYWQAIKDKDAETAAAMSEDPCLVVGAQGVGELSRAALGKMLEGGAYELSNFALEDFRLRPLGEDVVAVAYKVRETLELEGQTLKLEAFDASVWVRRDGQWTCALHTESLAGDPFGRR